MERAHTETASASKRLTEPLTGSDDRARSRRARTGGAEGKAAPADQHVPDAALRALTLLARAAVRSALGVDAATKNGDETVPLKQR
jgi:hypothetical protein